MGCCSIWAVATCSINASRTGRCKCWSEGLPAGLRGLRMITGVIALIVLKARGSSFELTSTGITWSLIAGLAGALGAFTLVLSLGAAGPIYKAAAAGAVMPIVFCGARS